LRFRQGLRLDQQALSFVAAAALAEAHDHGMSGAFRLDPAREQRISGGQNSRSSRPTHRKHAAIAARGFSKSAREQITERCLRRLSAKKYELLDIEKMLSQAATFSV
jgi:hypothetical protein